MTIKRSIAFLLCVIVAAAAHSPGAWAREVLPDYEPERFEVHEIITGLTQPMELDLGPDGEIYLI